MCDLYLGTDLNKLQKQWEICEAIANLIATTYLMILKIYC